VNATGLLSDVEDAVLTRPGKSVPSPMVSRSEQDLTPVAGVALWGPLLDRLNLVAEADRRGPRPIGPAATPADSATGRWWRFCSPVGTSCPTGRLLADPATTALRGTNALPRAAVPGCARQRSGPEPDQRDPLVVQDRDVAQHLPGQPMPEPVMSVQLSVEPADLVGQDRPDRHRPHVAASHGRDLPAAGRQRQSTRNRPSQGHDHSTLTQPCRGTEPDTSARNGPS
jgi:hypothetical protein